MQKENIFPIKKKKMIESYISSPLVKSFLAGSLSGTCSTIIFQPLDLVKTRIQNPQEFGKRPTGIFSVVCCVIRNEKLLGLWKGMVPSLSRTVPGIGVYFSSLHWLRNNFGSNDPRPLESVLMGAGARSISGVSMLPFTVVKTRFESGHFNYTSVAQALRTIYQLEGARGLFCGLSATLLRDVPFSGLYLMFYTQTKKFVRTNNLVEVQTPIIHFSCGIVAGCLAAVVTQPADVVKTHMQVDTNKNHQVRTVIMQIYKNGGASGFFRGIVPRTLRRTLMAALAWTVYEQMMATAGLK